MKAVTQDSLRDLILSYGLATAPQLEKAEELAASQKIPFEAALIKLNVISDTNLAQLLADYWNLPFVNLETQTIDEKTLNIVPELMARKQDLVPFKKDEKGLHVAMVDPTNLPARRLLEKKFDYPVFVHVATKSDITAVQRMYKAELSEELDTIIAEHVKAYKGTKSSEDEVELPIIRITDTLLAYGARNRASDIHIEPGEDTIIVRFRIDGILNDVVNLPKKIHNAIVTRIKILSKLRIDDHFSAQDGRFDYKYEGDKIDVRVSIIPITEGEKVVMRLLSESSRRFSLEDLGFSQRDLEKLNLAIARPHGMILATGPTGSGKTTTLYAIVQLINKRSINISTIEDPVEYDVEGVNQVQVNPKTNLTFAKGLRSMLRQDPDVIMVGEIRDEETAGISVNAAMTGHLVLSTLHANNASTALPRLADMAVEAFLVVSSVNVIVAQRLVRRICRRCIYSVELKKKEIDAIDKIVPLRKILGKQNLSKLRVYKGHGCKVCGHSGYAGRVGIYEVMLMDDDLRRLIIEKASADTIQKKARENGMTTMLEDGIDKALHGVTSMEEVMRVMADVQ